MLPVKRQGQTAEEGELLAHYRRLDAASRHTLLSFARFLTTPANDDQPPAKPQSPRPLPRPEDETVVAAIKRLTHSYYMLDTGPMLDETSGLMASHLLKGRPAPSVITDLESLFERHYARYRESFNTPKD